MDETYIKMCDCPEIQWQWEPKEGDNYVKKWTVVPEIPDQLDYVCVPYFLRDNPRTIHKPSFVWLPRQEDIQKMILEATGVPWEWSLLAEAMVFWAVDREHCALKNLNELWLMYYMNQAHNKTWTEEGWK